MPHGSLFEGKGLFSKIRFDMMAYLRGALSRGRTVLIISYCLRSNKRHIAILMLKIIVMKNCEWLSSQDDLQNESVIFAFQIWENFHRLLKPNLNVQPAEILLDFSVSVNP